MSEHINNPKFNYYGSSSIKIGSKGDFITSPEISQVFGELIGLWCANIWWLLDSPQRFNLIELGPGNGTLMKDALRALKIVPNFLDNVGIHLVETSDHLMKIQAKKLKGFNITWHKDLSTIPDEINIIVSNEFLDTFPIHQYEFGNSSWSEKYIGLNQDDKFCFYNQKINKGFLPEPGFLPNGSIVEFSPSTNSFFEKIAIKIKKNGGFALFIDYGYEKPSYISTLTSISRHKFVNIFKDIGNTDLSAYVNFGSLQTLASKLKVFDYGIISQRLFLENLGIYKRAESLIKFNPNKKIIIESEISKLTSPKEMGETFKVLAISQKSFNCLPGFK